MLDRPSDEKSAVKSSVFLYAIGYPQTAYFNAMIFSMYATAISSAESTKRSRIIGSRSISATATAINSRQRVMPWGG